MHYNIIVQLRPAYTLGLYKWSRLQPSGLQVVKNRWRLQPIDYTNFDLTISDH